MTNSAENQPRQSRDIQAILRPIVKRLGNCQEGVILNNASRALKSGDYGCAIYNIVQCLNSLNLTRGENKQLKSIILLLLKMKFSWMNSSVTDVLYWLFLYLLDHNPLTGLLWKLLQDTLSVYSILSSKYTMNLETYTLNDLADLLSFDSPEELRLFAIRAEKEYGFIKKWKDEDNHEKGYRIINPPSDELKAIQQKLLNTLLYSIPTPDYMGGGKGSSTKELMKKHMNKAMLICFDISNFFPSVKSQFVYKALRSRGVSKDVAEVLTQLTTYRGHLPQGGPCSTQLAKIVVMTPAKHLQQYLTNCFGQGFEVSFWIDDIVISGPISLGNFIKRKTIYDIFARYGFELKEEKTRKASKTEEQAALGIRVDHHRMRPCSTFMERYKKALHDEGESSLKIQGMRQFIRYVSIS